MNAFMPQAFPLLLGTAKVDITPKYPVSLAGFAFRTEPFEQVRSRLYARIFLFEQQQGDDGSRKRALLVSADLICWGSDRLPLIRQTLKQRWGLEEDAVILHATHSHSGPQTSERLLPSIGTADEGYLQWLEQSLYDGIGQAIETLEPVTVERGQGFCDFNINRRIIVNGTAVSGPNKDGPVDREVHVVRFRSSDSRTKAVLVHYTCHPTVTGDNYVSSEFPGAAMALIEQELDHQGLAAFIQGCCGDIRPALIRDGSFYRGSIREVRRFGRKLAEEALAVLRRPMRKVADLRLQTAGTSFPLPLQELPSLRALEENRMRDDVVGEWSRYLLEHPERIGQSVQFELSMLRLGGELVFLSMNGEVVVEYGLMLKRNYRGAILPVPYSNGMIGYIPTSRQIAEGGYEGRDSFVYFGLPAPFDLSLEEQITTRMKQWIEQWFEQ
jgi:hypothetical protein